MTGMIRRVSKYYGALPRRNRSGPTRAPEKLKSDAPLTDYALSLLSASQRSARASADSARLLRLERRLEQLKALRRKGAIAENDPAILRTEVDIGIARQSLARLSSSLTQAAPIKEMPRVSVEAHTDIAPETDSDSVDIPVPLPSEAPRQVTPSYGAQRVGQEAFREMVVSAYGACALTGCTDREALQAAHIIPYVDERSHLIANGICLRADVHILFDRGLIDIQPDYIVRVDRSLTSAEYSRLHMTRIALPSDETKHPSRQLLRLRIASRSPANG